MQSFFERSAYYDGIRQAALEAAEREIQHRIASFEPSLRHLSKRSLRLRLIDPGAIAACWHPMAFPWGRLHADFRAYFKRFEVAVFVDDVAQALAYGRPSEGPENVTIHFVERRMDDKDWLRGCAALIITDAAEAYAKALGKGMVKLKNPLPIVMPTYARLGFEHAGAVGVNSSMVRKVRP